MKLKMHDSISSKNKDLDEFLGFCRHCINVNNREIKTDASNKIK